MQEETPVRNRKKPINKKGKQTAPKRKVSKAAKMQPKGQMRSMAMNNPYQNVPVKTNNMVAMKSSNQVPRSGFGFPGAVI